MGFFPSLFGLPRTSPQVSPSAFPSYCLFTRSNPYTTCNHLVNHQTYTPSPWANRCRKQLWEYQPPLPLSPPSRGCRGQATNFKYYWLCISPLVESYPGSSSSIAPVTEPCKPISTLQSCLPQNSINPVSVLRQPNSATLLLPHSSITPVSGSCEPISRTLHRYPTAVPGGNSRSTSAME